MRKLQPYWHTPIYQPNAERPVEFELKPLNQETLYAVQASMVQTGVPSWSGVKAAFENGVVGWKNVDLDGAPAEFNPANVAKILKQVGSADWLIWLGAIAGELRRNAFLSDAEKKT